MNNMNEAIFVVTFFVTVVNLLTILGILCGHTISWPRYKVFDMTNFLFLIPSAFYQIWFWFHRMGVI